MASLLTVVLNAAWYVVAIFLALIVVLVLAGANIGLQIGADGPNVVTGPNVVMAIPVSVTLDPGAHQVTAPSLGIEAAELGELSGTLRFPPRKDLLFVANLAILTGSLALLLWVLSQLRALFRALGAGRPFVPANATRVRRIAWAVIVGELARSAVLFFEGHYAMTHFSAAGLTFGAQPYVNVFAIINGLIILVIAEVFREGTRLDEERSLTI